MRLSLCCSSIVLVTMAIVRPALSQSALRSTPHGTLGSVDVRGGFALVFAPPPPAGSVAILYAVRAPLDREIQTTFADTVIKRNRRVGALIGGGIGFAIGGVVGYGKGDSRVAFDQVAGAAVYGAAGALLGAIIGANVGPRVR